MTIRVTHTKGLPPGHGIERAEKWLQAGRHAAQLSEV